MRIAFCGRGGIDNEISAVRDRCYRGFAEVSERVGFISHDAATPLELNGSGDGFPA